MEVVDTKSRLCTISMEVSNELEKAISKYDSFASPHEGYAIIKEELDELWDTIKNKNIDKIEQRKEAIQVAAMAIRYVLDLCT